jgi:nitroreductase
MKFIKKLIIYIIGRKRLEFIWSKPFLVHGKYHLIINDLNKYSDIINQSNDHDPYMSLLLVRKYAHIIDKGLHRSIIEKGHSKGIVLELTKNIEIAEKHFKDDCTIKWAKEKIAKHNELQLLGAIDPLSENKNNSNLSYEDVNELFQCRRSNRSFLSKTIDVEILEKLAATVNWAPSSCNKQPIVIFATSNPKIAMQCLSYCKGATGFDDFIPAFAVFTADMRGYYLPDEAYLPFIDVSLGAQNFLLAAETLGLSCCILTWAQKTYSDELELRKILNIDKAYQIVFNAAIGYPKKNSITPARKKASDTIVIRE